jgi:hypothetical protein
MPSGWLALPRTSMGRGLRVGVWMAMGRIVEGQALRVSCPSGGSLPPDLCRGLRSSWPGCNTPGVLTDLSTERVTEKELHYRQRMVLALGAISTLIAMSVQCSTGARENAVGKSLEKVSSRRSGYAVARPS